MLNPVNIPFNIFLTVWCSGKSLWVSALWELLNIVVFLDGVCYGRGCGTYGDGLRPTWRGVCHRQSSNRDAIGIAISSRFVAGPTARQNMGGCRVSVGVGAYGDLTHG
jgi:hypothetical protein